MLCLMHESERRGALMLNGQPMPRIALSRALGLPLDELNASIARLVQAGVASLEFPHKGQQQGEGQGEEEGVILCRRMVRDEGKRQGQIEDGKRGGNPALVENYNAPGYVYAIQRQSDLKIKIGISINPTKRLYKLRYASKGDTLTLLAAKYVENMGAYEAELHRKYAEFASGEWFSLPLLQQGELVSTLNGQIKERPKGTPPPSSSSSTSKQTLEKTPPLPETARIDANMMARGLCERLNLSRGMGKGTVYEAAYDLALQEEKRGRDLEKLCDRMVEAYQRLLREAPQLEYTWGPAKFFADGHWLHPELWPRKDGANAPKPKILSRPGE
jgi:hypothetical protein